MSDSDDSDGGPESKYKPSFVLIAIDVDPAMFVKAENGNSPFRNCINACYNLANSLMFTQSKRSWSPFGIVLAREDASASFVNFNDNVLKTIKFLKEKKDSTDDNLEELYKRKGSVDLSAFFLLCKKKFKEVNAVFYQRKIVYITNDDNPVRGDNQQKFAALNEAKNFNANSIIFEMITMNASFDYKLFYNELFSVINLPVVETLVEDEEGLLEKLSSLIIVRYFQRKMHFYPSCDNDERFLKVIQKSFIKDETIYNNAFMSSDGQFLKKTGQRAITGALKFVLRTNTGHLDFDPSEAAEIKANSLPIGYSLLYVADRVTEVGCVLKDTLILEVSPDEELPFFESIWQYCVEKNKVLVCARKLRKVDRVRLVELIPKFANFGKHFIIKALPFSSEHQRTPSALVTDEEPEYSERQIAKTDALIDALTYDYDPKMFSNPVLAKKKAFLRSKLLDEPKEDVEVVTLDNNAIDESLGEVGEEFKNLFRLKQEETGTKRKRRAPASAAKRRN